MNTSALRRKRIVIPTIAAVALLGAGATVWSATADNDVTGSTRDKVAAAAVAVVGGGTATDVETSDDRGEAYEVEVRTSEGTSVDVTLDSGLQEVSREQDHDEADEADDTEPSAADRAAAAKAALAAVGSGKVLDVDTSDDRGVAYEVEVVDADSVEWGVDLDASFTVVRKQQDD